MKTLLTLVLAALTLVGCGTTSNEPRVQFDPPTISKVTTDVVSLYSILKIKKSPESRPKFEAAQQALAILVDNQTWDLSAMAQALATTGLSASQSDEVLLVVSSTVSLIDNATGAKIDLSKVEYARAVILGGYNGLNRALKLNTT